jgi:hypothetical protein
LHTRSLLALWNADGAASARRRMPPRLWEEPLQTVAGPCCDRMRRPL